MFTQKTKELLKNQCDYNYEVDTKAAIRVFHRKEGVCTHANKIVDFSLTNENHLIELKCHDVMQIFANVEFWCIFHFHFHHLLNSNMI